MSNVTTLPPPLSTSTTPLPIIIDDGLSGGSVFCLFFFLSTAVYFGGGILVKKYMRGAEGFEAVPNLAFWLDLPNLIREGIIFALNGCQPELTYERI